MAKAPHVEAKLENGENHAPTATIEQFEILAHIGSGAYGEVAGVRKLSGKDVDVIYAMKVMEKKRMGKHKDMVDHEFKILTTVANPFFTKMMYSFQTNRHLVFVMPYAGGGDMLTMMEAACLTEEKSHFYLCELVEAVGYLHSRHIIHRDIKLENLLIANDGHLMITDYGLSATGCDSDDAIKGVIGTRHTMAPEVHLEKSYGPACDWWAVGITYCDMRSDKSVFDGADSKEYSESTVKKRPRFPKVLSPRERGFVNKLIVRDPAFRLGHGPNGTEDVKTHDMFKGVCWDDVLGKKLIPPFIPNPDMIRTFKCFPDSAKQQQFPKLDHEVSLYWEDIDYTDASLANT